MPAVPGDGRGRHIREDGMDPAAVEPRAEESSTITETSRSVDTGDELIAVTDVARSFGRRQVLRGVTFAARRGEMVGIVGENGAGKSTLLRIMAGLLPASRGLVQMRGRLGYCPQDPEVHSGLTIAQNLEWFRSAYRLRNLKTADELMDRLAFRQYRDTLVAELSGGTRQKLNLTVALMHDPDVLLLDEPYQGFDWETYLRFWGIAEQARLAGQAIVIISHLLYERRRFDSLFRLRDGVLLPEGGA
jgi:ABC-2 type transport system ATP-binding protein